MSHLTVKEALEKILSKSEKASEVFKKVLPEHLDEVRDVLSHLSKKYLSKEELKKPGANAAATSIMNAFGGGGGSAPAPAPAAPSGGSLASNITSGLNHMMGKGEECYKVDANGQWKIEKGDGTINYAKPKTAIKPGPTLNYKEMNAKPAIKPGPAMDYSKPKPNIKPGPTLDYSKQPKQNKWAMSPEEHHAAFNRISENRKKVAEKYGPEALNKPKSKGVNKDEGVLEDKEPSGSQKSRMMVKNMGGEMPEGSSMSMSEKDKIKKESESGLSNENVAHPDEALSKPPVSEAQRKAMGAAASGHSNLGISSAVGKEFIDADKGGKLPEKKEVDKAEWITPEQQKINRAKLKESDNKTAAAVANIKLKESDKPKTEVKKEPAKVIPFKKEDVEKSIYNAGTHPPKGYDPNKKTKGRSPDSWKALNHSIHKLEQSGKAGSSEHKALTNAWEKETGSKYQHGMAGKEI